MKKEIAGLTLIGILLFIIGNVLSFLITALGVWAIITVLTHLGIVSWTFSWLLAFAIWIVIRIIKIIF